jgi:hypothetical protein
MRSAHVSKRILIVLLVQAAAAVALAFLSNLFLDSAVRQFRESRLSGNASKGMSAVSADVASLEERIGSLRDKVAGQSGIRYPSVQDLKELSARFNLRIRKMDKQSQQARSESVTGHVYSVVCLGGLADLVAFLKQMEETHVLESDNIVLQRYNEDGTVLALGLTLLVREM